MNFLQGELFNKSPIQYMLKDFHCTVDFQGCFEKQQMMIHMTNYRGFMPQSGKKRCKISDLSPGTIIDDNSTNGRNCLTFITEVDGVTILCKAYNKFVQCLETNAVGANIGHDWEYWVEKEDACLASSRDNARERGLTRVEMTFYINDSKNKIPSEGLLMKTLEDIK